MVKAQRGKPGSDRRGNTVRRVESAADTDLEDHDVEPRFDKDFQSQQRQKLEVSRHAHPLVCLGFQLRPQVVERRDERALVDGPAVDPDPLADVPQVWRREEARRVARAPQDRLGHGAGRALALCSRDVDDAELVELVFGDRAGRRGRSSIVRLLRGAARSFSSCSFFFTSDHQSGPLQAQRHHLHGVLPLPGPAIAAGAPGDERSQLGEDALIVSVEVRVGGRRSRSSSSSSISVFAGGGCFCAIAVGIACDTFVGTPRWKIFRSWHLNRN